MEFYVGARVYLNNIHKNHNKAVKEKLGKPGIIQAISGFRNNDCLVLFDEDLNKFGDRRLWIKDRWLSYEDDEK